MKHTKCSLRNISGEILGIITHKAKLLNKSDYVIVGDYETGHRGYAATLSYLDSAKGEYPIIYDVDKEFILNDGDVVFAAEDGTLSILYEINSRHNSLMATERCNHRCIMCPQPPIVQEKDKTNFNI